MKNPIVPSPVAHLSSGGEEERRRLKTRAQYLEAIPTRRRLEGEQHRHASPDGISRAIVLLSDGLLTPEEFEAYTTLPVGQVPGLLDEPLVLAEVQRQHLELQTSGSLARLEALRHAREAVKTAVLIMRDQDMLPSNRLNAANFIARAAGTDRPAHDAADPAQEPVRITICFGGQKLVVEADPAKPAVDTGEP
jgi:hypothetical protein